jgi:glutamyl-tRNA synthetase
VLIEPALRAPSTGGVRFAPSPTGRFHIGNLRTAWVSHLIARHFSLPWVVRFEDIDRPRVLKGALENQLADMKTLGLVPDHVLLQSRFEDRHWELFKSAIEDGAIYACDCSRKEVQAALEGLASAPHGEVAAYSGHCRPLSKREMKSVDSIAWRFKMPAESGVQDFIVARSGHALDTNGVPARATFTPSYHWACAIDDFDGHYDWIVRSNDLSHALPLQRAIQTWVATEEMVRFTPAPAFHTSLVVQDDGKRLEKRTEGVTLPELISEGLTAKRILTLFEKSFRVTEFNGDSAETVTTLPLSTLLQAH